MDTGHNLRKRTTQSSSQQLDSTTMTETTLLPSTRQTTTPKLNIRQSILRILILFTIGSTILYTVFQFSPPFSETEKPHIKVPKNFDEARALGKVLHNYKDTHYYSVLACYFTTYIFLVSFSVPGSTSLSVLAGFLYPSWLAIFFVCLSSAVGAVFCYLLADAVGRVFVEKYLTERLEAWRKQVDKNKDDLMSYLLFLRITPFLPNWFINITSPVLNIPVSKFFWATFIGVAPLQFIAVSSGKEINKLVTFGDALSYDSIIFCVAAAVVAILPIIVKKFFAKKFGMDTTDEDESIKSDSK